MNFPEKENEVLAFWKENNIFKKTIEKPAPKGSFVFYEGPPTANGKPGIHHAESRAFKDCIPRFKTMQGYKVVRKAGWDTHGLPVELEVEKQLGFTGKAQIEEYGIAKFNAMCKESVWAYKKDWEEFTERLGFWVDFDEAYITYKPEYVESLWWVVKQIWERGLLYKDYRVTPHCPRCGTSLSSHELSQGYKDVKDLSVTAKFKIVGAENEYLLAWTTTPWTLPGNVALAVGNAITYAKVKVGEEFLWLAKDLIGSVLPEGGEIVEELKGASLVGKMYEPLYPFMGELVEGEQKEKLENTAFRVHPADFVTTQDGTGIVHTAVMYGADDFQLGNEVGLPKHHLVNLDGTFVKGTGFFEGRFVADEQVAVDVIKDLAHRGRLFTKAKYEHSYPHCWRCKTKVIYYAKDSWYIRMSELRDELLAQNANIHWEPEHIRDGRFGEWLREVKDWAFSRERYWGTPLPLWESEDGDRICIGSFEELKSLAKDPSLVGDTFDPHRPFVDEIILVKEGKEFTRVLDVCDVWFDSGCMPYAQWHYPFENKELVDSGEAYPADYISEAIDQTRGWFYTLLAVSTLLDRERPYKNVICLGHVLDAEGKKMSKSLGNIVKPMEMIDTYGADAVRWYMYTINQPGEAKRFDEKTLNDMVRKNFTILMNVATFYEMFADEGVPETVSPTHVLDRWISARLHRLVKDTTERLEKYVVTETVRELSAFIDDLSTWYVRRSRDRMKGEDEGDRLAALATLQSTLITLSKLLAPFAPFFAETLYKQVGGTLESVHLEEWPIADEGLIDANVLEEMGRTRSVVSKALERRSDAGINVRQALGGMTVTVPSGEFASAYQALVMDEVNVKSIEVKKGDYAVELDLVLTPELVREGTVREIIRRVNDLRKKEGLTLEDRIDLYVGGSEDILQAVREHETVLLQGTLAVSLRTDGDVPATQNVFKANELEITIGF
ncbi:isoleucine--tRNA ligase [Candidatus Uhrbacteria bacterium CG10_big_fil_rev_8_21_14_0_10_48_16]|uniref:Isoleucine--tRNA ligase n=1 Tax=Candidatus Uhrbacteria bacterium CG10_big_fil_rev_8_21_14_0_10_48_16 TaxID=1975038 RepID=A0A2M8LHM9_9BACT|nr:MAG: isoleucine--tRNA ligase [Candidatus Uhrbacteria bacterium CG10_big_fil_rev_8_21_14_0_10_48_16]